MCMHYMQHVVYKSQECGTMFCLYYPVHMGGGGQVIGGWFWSASTTPPRSKQVWHCLVVRPGPILRNILQYTLLGSNQGCSIEHNQQTKFSQLKHESTFSVSDRLLLGEGDYWTTLHEAAMIEKNASVHETAESKMVEYVQEAAKSKMVEYTRLPKTKW